MERADSAGGASDLLPPPGSHAGNNLLAINPHRNPYKVRIPYGLAGIAYTARVRICVSATGSVEDVTVVEPSVPAIDSQLPVVMRRWKYHPFMVDGQPTSFCYLLNYHVR